MPQPLKIFICYAREDRDAVDDLRKHLKQAEKNQLLEIWDDGEILAGQHWDRAIKARLETAQLILLLVSVDFINSDYIGTTELQAALQRHRDGHATLVPVIVRRCDWLEHFGIGQFQALPKEARPIKSVDLSIREEVYYEVAQGIKAVAQEMRAKAAREAEQAERQAAEAKAAQEQAEAAAQSERENAQRAARQAENRLLKDEAAWETAREENTLHAYETYLEDGFALHKTEAEQQVRTLQAAAQKQKAAERAAQEAEAKAEAERKAREEAERLAAEAQRAKEAAACKKAEEEAAAKFDPFHDLMVPIKGGSFDMGSNDYASEQPVHRVTVRDFHLSKYPVTQAQWKKIMGDNPAHFKGDELPVEQVSWNDAQVFLKKLNEKTGKTYRLPTEAEWEYAAKGGNQSKGYQYAGSNDLKEVGWYWENSGDKPLSGDWDWEKIKANNCRTHPVGQKKPNELGLYDLSGNVWEWCSDWYGAYPAGSQTNPAGAKEGPGRVLRGGSWYYYDYDCRSAYRISYGPDFRNYYFGFRLAQD